MSQQALEGVNVLDFTWYAAGPQITKYLASWGATVVRVESNTRLDRVRTNPPFKDGKPGLNRSGQLATLNHGKYGMTLNLKHPLASKLTKKLVTWADIVVENFTAGTMEKLGLGYQELTGINPEVIYLRSTNQGQTGPHARHPGFGILLESLSGVVSITGWPDRAPVIHGGLNTDMIGARFGLIAILAALDYRRRTGKGHYIDLSQYECALQFISPLIIDFNVNGVAADRMGNHCPYAAPHGVYPCQGEDRWCVISVFSDEEWQRFCQAMGNPELASQDKFATLLARKQNEDELNRLIGEWTRNFTSEEIMEKMQAHGVSGGVVKSSRDVYLDEQLNYRKQWQEREHSELGKHRCDLPGCKLSKTPANVRMPAPCIGEHNEYVCCELLGLADDEFMKLLTEGVFD